MKKKEKEERREKKNEHALIVRTILRRVYEQEWKIKRETNN